MCLQGYNILTTIVNVGGVASASPTAANGDGGAPTSASIYYPNLIFVDSQGNVYFADYNNNKIRKLFDFQPTQQPSSQPTRQPSSQPSRQPTRNPTSYLSAQGTLQQITTIAGNGVTASGGNGGLATAASFLYPQGIWADTAGNVYISENTSGL